LRGPLPQHLQEHRLFKEAWAGIDPTQVWDCHVHLLGLGDSDSGIWINPNMRSAWNLLRYTQFKFYFDASCVIPVTDTKEALGTTVDSVDKGYLQRLLELHDDFPPGVKFMLLAFEHNHDETGKPHPQNSPFHTPNQYTARIAEQYSERFEWIASVHPYREDALQELSWCIEHGARAVKWLPGVMGIDPSSSRCDEFYDLLVRHRIPILTHSGTEYAVNVEGGEALNNPLLLRRALDRGVTVIFAHCASLGESVDLDYGKGETTISNLTLFFRLLTDADYQGQVYGDISAITLVNRNDNVLETLLRHEEWHQWLVNGSDYPLPGVLPIVSLPHYVRRGYLTEEDAEVLREIRQYNPMLFDFVLKRAVKISDKNLKPMVFHTRHVFSTN
jgi:mannonate dehydratase